LSIFGQSISGQSIFGQSIFGQSIFEQFIFEQFISGCPFMNSFCGQPGGEAFILRISNPFPTGFLMGQEVVGSSGA
jgi:hypothetical protein